MMETLKRIVSTFKSSLYGNYHDSSTPTDYSEAFSFKSDKKNLSIDSVKAMNAIKSQLSNG